MVVLVVVLLLLLLSLLQGWTKSILSVVADGAGCYCYLYVLQWLHLAVGSFACYC